MRRSISVLRRFAVFVTPWIGCSQIQAAVNALVESEHLQNAADAVGQVTAVDGATVLDMDLG